MWWWYAKRACVCLFVCAYSNAAYAVNVYIYINARKTAGPFIPIQISINHINCNLYNLWHLILSPQMLFIFLSFLVSCSRSLTHCCCCCCWYALLSKSFKHLCPKTYWDICARCIIIYLDDGVAAAAHKHTQSNANVVLIVI